MQLKIVLLAIIIIALIAVIIVHFTSSYSIFYSPLIENHDSLSTLVLVQVIFRHGDRTLDPGHFYPTDPHYNYSYFPNHLGNINKKGRLKSYNLGKELRTRYGKFLGDEYYSGIVKSFSSNYDRTQMTLQCVHAGLFSTKGPIDHLDWRPIPYEIFETDKDKYIGVLKYCPTMPKPTDPIEDEDIRELFNYLYNHSRISMNNLYEFIYLADIFKIQKANGLELPEWSKSVFPEPMGSIQNKAWNIYFTNNVRLGSAGLIKLVTNHAQDVVNHNVKSAERKMILYSGHDYNLMFFMGALRCWDGIATRFTSYIAVELHLIDGIYGLKVYYENRRDSQLLRLKFPFCKDYFCPLDVFIAKSQWLYDPEPHCPLFQV